MVARITKSDVIIVDFFDTVVHRRVHPFYVFSLWARFMQAEFSIALSVDDLYQIRRDAIKYISVCRGIGSCEASYEDVAAQTYKRLVDNNSILGTAVDAFCKASEVADLKAEKDVQYLNKRMVDRLKTYRDANREVLLCTDTFLSGTIIADLLKYHQIDDLFSKVYVSSDVGASKQSGSIYHHVLKENGLDADQVTMIGDNKKTDFEIPKSIGINSIYIPNRRKRFMAKRFLLKNEEKQVNRCLRSIERNSAKGPQPYGEYSILLYTFTHGLYQKLKRDQVKNIFFLSREGLFLKKLFDKYQERHALLKERNIKTHYIKISRKSSMLISLKPLNEETFAILKRYPKMSGQQFLESLVFSDEHIQKICAAVKNTDRVNDNFFETDTFSQITKNRTFIGSYDDLRKSQRAAFAKYIKSFDVDIPGEGMHIVDVGWGGTMQENLHRFFGEKTNVTGYYLGLRYIYNITESTKRYGILFSVYPAASSYDDILQGNCQIYEQILAAGHGYAKAYDAGTAGYVLEEIEENESAAYTQYIKPLQAYYEQLFLQIDEELADHAYTLAHLKAYSFKLAIRMGIFLSKRNAAFVSNISKGFNQNVGVNNVGINYNRKDLGLSNKELLIRFLIYPESLFKYVVKFKQLVKRKNIILSSLTSCYYPYVIIHRFIRKTFFRRLPQK